MNLVKLLVLSFLVTLQTSVVSFAQDKIVLKSGAVTFTAEAEGFRYAFSVAGKVIVPPDGTAGLMLANSPVSVKGRCTTSPCVLKGTTLAGRSVRVTITLDDHHAELVAEPDQPGDKVEFISGGAMPAYGLADHAVEQKKFSTLDNKQFSTDVTGFSDDAFLSGQGQTRLVSNFVIYCSGRRQGEFQSC